MALLKIKWFRLFFLMFIIIISTNSYSTNTAPRITSVPIKLTKELDFYTYSITAEDSDNDSLIFKCEKKPSWLNFEITGKTTAKLSGVPEENFATNGDSIIISVSDGELQDTQVYILLVDYVAVLPSFKTKPDTIAYCNKLYKYEIDIEAYYSEYLITICENKPDWLNFIDYGNGKALLSGIPDFMDTAKVYEIKIRFNYGSSSNYKLFKIKVLNETGLINIEDNENLLISPNPTNNFCRISGVNKIDKIDKIDLFDIHGSLIQENNNLDKIDLSGCSTGIYFIKISTSKNSSFYKIIKE